MTAILIAVIVAFIMGTSDIVDFMLSELTHVAFYAEAYMTRGFLTGTSLDFNVFFTLFFNFGVALIVLKFLKKGFEVYIMWTDGDPDFDPLTYVVNFLRALVIAISFPILYGWLADVCTEAIDTIIGAFNVVVGSSLIDMILNLIVGSLFQAIAGLVLVICWLLLWLQLIMRGIEMLILRIGMPLACMGLIDNDRGVFAPYMKKFFQSAMTVIVQISLVKLSVTIMGMGEIIYSVAVCLVAIKTPRFLQEFMLYAISGGSITNTIYHSSRLYQMAKAALKK